MSTSSDVATFSLTARTGRCLPQAWTGRVDHGAEITTGGMVEAGWVSRASVFGVWHSGSPATAFRVIVAAASVTATVAAGTRCDHVSSGQFTHTTGVRIAADPDSQNASAAGAGVSHATPTRGSPCSAPP
jgi:hypothetical protein